MLRIACLACFLGGWEVYFLVQGFGVSRLIELPLRVGKRCGAKVWCRGAWQELQKLGGVNVEGVACFGPLDNRVL